MNEANYASLEASKKLFEAGIVLETEAGWYKIFRPGSHAFDMVLSARSGNEKFYGDNFPAPSMAEVWRELPFGDWELYQLIRKYLMFRGLDFEDYSVAMELIRIARSADALIDLLIFIKGLDAPQ